MTHTFLLENKVEKFYLTQAAACTSSTSVNHSFPEVAMADRELHSRDHALPVPRRREEPAAIALPT